MSAIEIFGVFLFLTFIVSCIGMIAFLATWVYKDAKARGLNAPLWTLIVIIAGQRLIGLLIYLFVGRKESKVTCPECFEKTSAQAKFCDKCGKPINQDTIAKPKSAKKWLIAMLVAFIVAVITGMGTMAVVIKSGYDGRFPMNISMGKMETRFGNKWKVSFMRSNETMNKTIYIRDGNPETLYFEGSCDEGSMLLVITLDDETITYDISGQNENISLNLGDYDTDSVKMTVINTDVKDGSFNAYWE